MSLKNARTLGIRLDQNLDARLTSFENKTHIEGVSLCRAALKAALDEFESAGSLSLPLRIVSAKNTPPQETQQQPAGPPKPATRYPIGTEGLVDHSTHGLNANNPTQEPPPSRSLEHRQKVLKRMTDRNRQAGHADTKKGKDLSAGS